MRRIKLETMIFKVMYPDANCLNCGAARKSHYISYDEEYNSYRSTCPLRYYADSGIKVTYYESAQP